MQNRTQLIRFGLATAAGLAGLFASANWSSPQNVSLITEAQARIGRPLTPGSIAGVNRRVDRRTARRAYYGTGGYYGNGAYYGTGAAIGTAAAVGAAGAYWGGQYYNNSYNGNSYYGAVPGQYYGTYPGQYYGTYTAETTRPMTNKNYDGPAYYGPYAYAGMNQVAQAQAETQITTGRTPAWCAARYRSFDAATGTFLGYDGRRHACP